MSNYISKPEHKEIANITSLTAEPYNGYYLSERASRAVGRFVQTASLLPGNGFLGWQMNSDKEGNLHTFAFSSQDVRMTADDFGWIFQKCAGVEAEKTDSFEALHKDFRKVYVLRHIPGISDELQTFGSQHLPSEDTDYLGDVVKALKESGGAIRIMAETSHDGQGMILLRLAEEMTLRMRTMLSLAFPDTVMAEALTADANTDFRLPAKYLMESMKRLLEVFILEESSVDSEEPAYRFPCEDDEDLVDATGFDDPDEYDMEDPSDGSLPEARRKSDARKASDRALDKLSKIGRAHV